MHTVVRHAIALTVCLGVPMGVVLVTQPDVGTQAAQALGLSTRDVGEIKHVDGTIEPGSSLWGACDMNVLVNTADMPRGTEKEISQAVTGLDKVSTIRMRFGGTTSRTTDPRATAPTGTVVVGFTHASPLDSPQKLVGAYRGRAYLSNSSRVASGVLSINVDAYAALAPTGRNSRHALLQHELAHALGLGHSRERESLMFTRLGDASGVTSDVVASLPAVAPTNCRR